MLCLRKLTTPFVGKYDGDHDRLLLPCQGVPSYFSNRLLLYYWYQWRCTREPCMTLEAVVDACTLC